MVVKMVGKLVEHIEEIRAYINVCTKLGHSVKLSFTKLGEVHESHNVAYETVRSWRKKIILEESLLKMLQKG